MSELRLAVAFALAALVLVAPASASRAPTKAEVTALRVALRADRIVSERISTRDPRYASATVVTKHGSRVDVLHKTFSSWWVLASGPTRKCTVAPASVFADLGLTCTPPAGVAWIDSCGPLVSAPSELVLACADGNYYVTNLKWHAWGGGSATSTGTAHQNDCKPYCAAGHFHAYPVEVTASRLRTCGAARYYARLEIVYPAAHPTAEKASFLAMTC